MSAQAVGVLAVMDAAAWGTDVPEHREAIQDARAAVAGLIEESRAVLSVMHAAGLNDAALRAAIARVQGAKP